VLGALGIHAEGLYQELVDSTQAAARQLFLRLVTLGEGTVDTRRRVLMSELEAIGVSGNPTTTEDWSQALDSVIGLFGSHRLLTFDRNPTTREPTVEVAHEALLGEWTRLGGWLDESRADVRMQRVLGNAPVERAAAERDPSFLLRGSRLEQYEGWAASTDLALTADERLFLDASQADEAQRTAARLKLERRSRNILRALVAVFAVAAVIAVVLTIIALNAQGAAEEQAAIARDEANQRATAVVEAEIAEHNALMQASIGLSSQAELEIDGPYPERAILLGLEALENYPYTWQAERALGQIVREFRLRNVLSGHTDEVLDIDWSPDGDRIVTASRDDTAKVWDATSGELIATFSGHNDYVTSASWKPDGTLIATAGVDAIARIWDPATGEQLFVFSEHSGGIKTVAWSPDGKSIATASDDGTARIWDAESGGGAILIAEHDGPVWSVAWSPDGSKVATAGQDSTVRLWNADSGEQLTKINLVDSVYRAVWSPDGTQLATASADGIAQVWDPITSEVIFNLQGRIPDQFDIAWSPDGEWLGTSTGPGSSARIWDASPAAITLPSGGAIAWTNWSPDGTKIALSGGTELGSGVGQASVWDFAAQQELFSLQGDYGELNCVYWSPDGSRLSTSGMDGLGKIWDAETGEELLTFDGHLADPPHPIFDIQAIWGGAWSPDSRFIATGGGSGWTRVWDAATGEEIHLLVIANVCCSGIPAWSPDGSELAVSEVSHNLQIYNTHSGKLLRGEPVESNENFDFSMSNEWSPDGSQILTTGFTPNARIWDSETLELISTFPEHTTWELASVWSPNGQRIASPDFSGVVKIWDAQTATELLSFDVPYNEYVYSVSWSPDGKWVAVGSQMDIVNIYPVWQTAEDLVEYAKECCIVRELTPEERDQFGLPVEEP